MIIFLKLLLIGEAKCHIHLKLVLGLILSVTTLTVCLPELYACKTIITDKLIYVVNDAVLVHIFICFELGLCKLISENKPDSVINNRLSFKCLLKILKRDIDIGKYLHIGAPLDSGACILLIVGSFLHLPVYFTSLEAQLVAEATCMNLCLHVLGCILCSTETETVETERIFVATAVICIVLTTCIKVAENKLPVVALLTCIVVNRYTSTEVLHLYRFIEKACYDNLLTVTLSRLVD